MIQASRYEYCHLSFHKDYCAGVSITRTCLRIMASTIFKQNPLVCLYVCCHLSVGLCRYWLLKMMNSLAAGIKEMSQHRGKKWMLNKWFYVLMIENHFQLHLVYVYSVTMACMAFCK